MATRENESGPAETRAYRAAAAGQYIARKLGMPEALGAQTMWRVAREGQIRVFRLGRTVWFPQAALDEFIERGGTTAIGTYQGRS
jgi:hypothetical protein